MNSILEELFYGNVCPNTDCKNHEQETKELMGYLADHHYTLLKEFTDINKRYTSFKIVSVVCIFGFTSVSDCSIL